jgi:hypothetical protein
MIRTIYAVALDVNRDGRMDVITARYHPGLIYCWNNRRMLHDKWAHHIIDDAADGGTTVSCMLPLATRMATVDPTSLVPRRTAPEATRLPGGNKENPLLMPQAQRDYGHAIGSPAQYSRSRFFGRYVAPPGLWFVQGSRP